ncbi:alpha/beta hydrolase family protein [Archangium primigenium]|uniref:alpha/beta hydrolase family protein n=1 Tax=[Archangium] primigenium TaxID=2792470 RepID=UPI001958A002|nr:alpha/beta fold hydrolase [Archangium primigenium]MBM7114438.1 alpha/beta fold hydrolase [Archangium primigenium]
MKQLTVTLASFALLSCTPLASGTKPAGAPGDRAVVDPPRDTAHPARNQQLLIESHGSRMNALFFLASGAGPHPTMLLLHGLPGNERNLDLAQAVRRAGWNVLTFTYRGAWGSEGDFSIAHGLEDTAAAMAFLRSPEAIRAHGIDVNRLVIAGHSMGGYAAAHEAAAEHDSQPPLAGLVLLDAWNIARSAARASTAGPNGRAHMVANLNDFGRALHGATPESTADELLSQGPGWSLPALAPRLTRVPILSIYATHGSATENKRVAEALREAGARVDTAELDSDHAFADHRIELARELVRWLERPREPSAPPEGT